jgi:hypothetical protein
VIKRFRAGDYAGRKADTMNARSTLIFLLPSCLVFVAACGVSTLGGGGTGQPGTGGSINNPSSGGYGNSSSTGGSVGSGTGVTCSPSPGGHAISVADLSNACTTDSDCIAVFAGDVCSECTCPNTAIASTEMAAYDSLEAAKQAGCCPNEGPTCECPTIGVPTCQSGTCTLLGGGSADGGTCVPGPGDHTVSTTGFSRACTVDSDCVPVFEGDTCAACTCPNTAIASSQMSAYDSLEGAAHAGCCDVGVCGCPALAATCQSGTCSLYPPAPLCNGRPSPVSCTSTSCPSGFSCSPDPDPTKCHPSGCECTASGWACLADCEMNGSTCYQGL